MAFVAVQQMQFSQYEYTLDEYVNCLLHSFKVFFFFFPYVALCLLLLLLPYGLVLCQVKQ